MGDNAEKRKHGAMLPSTIRAIICGPSNYGKTNVLISLLESHARCTFRERVRILEIIETAIISIFENLLSSIDEIDYFTFSNNSDVVLPSEAHPNSIFVFDDVACDKQDTVREYFSMDRLARRLFLSLPIIRENS